ncbi:MAG: hypothetical protein QM713_09985 [Arachnia sp.]
MSRIGQLLHLLPSGRHDRAVAAELDLRVPLPVVRRVAFAALAGGTGCSTAAARVAATLAARRPGGVLLTQAGAEESRRGEQPRRTHELTLTDWGVRALPELSAVAAESHLVCLTTTIERVAVQRALDAAAFLQASGTPTILVASALRGRPTVGARRMLASSPIPLHLLPHDPTARRLESTGVSDATAFALAELGAAIVRAGAGARTPVGVA